MESYSMNKSHKQELSTMLKEINSVINNHLTNILTPVLEETNNINSILLNVPMIAKMRDDFKILNQKLVETNALNKELQSEINTLKNDLKSAYDKIQNIRLEVKELPNNNKETLNIPYKSYESNNKIMENKPVRLANTTNLDYFSNLISEDDDDDDEEDDDAKTIHIDKLNLNLSSKELRDMGSPNDEEEEEVEDEEEEVEEEDDDERR